MAILAACSNSAAAEKRVLRQQILAARRAMPRAAQQAASAVLRQKIAALPLFQNARTVAAFAPMESEPDIWPLLESCWHSGKTVALPRVREARRMDFHAVSSRRELEEGYKGIMQPPGHFPVLQPQALDFMIVPAAAADRRRYRLGYGGGFYDTFMAQLTHATTCAPVFACQLIPKVPAEAHDKQVDIVFSDNADSADNATGGING